MGDFFNDLGNAIGDVGRSIGNEVSRAVDELGDAIVDDVESIGTAVESGGLVGGALEAFDVFSPGNALAEGLDAFNVIPEDPALKELVSAGGNLFLGVGPQQLLALKDIADSVSAIGAANPAAPAPAGRSGSRGDAALPPSQGNDRPGHVHERRCCEEVVVVVTGVAGPGRSDRVRGRPVDGDRGGVRPGDGFASSGPGGTVLDGLERGMTELLERLRDLFGDGKASDADDEIDRILSNPSLSFEDMIFQLLRTVLKQGQDEAKVLAADLKDARKASNAERDALTEQIDGLREELAGETDPQRRQELQGEIDALRDERATKASDAAESRAAIAEELKNITQKLSEMQQALSNILNAMHESAMAAIRNIR
jgi:hypothetical protein